MHDAPVVRDGVAHRPVGHAVLDERLRLAGCTNLRFACLLAAPEGLAVLAASHPDVPVFTCAVDRGLDDHAYIRPGLGDAGDRLYGTK